MAPPTTSQSWVHTPSTAVLLWLAVLLPLVAWDIGYVLLRPHTMPGGSLHRPLWVPYALYGEVDHMYGFKQWNQRNPWTATQSWMNVVESLMYLAYLWLWSTYGKAPAAGARKAIGGRVGAAAVLLGFSAAVMTVSKTVIYWLLEILSGFENIGQNHLWTMIFLWVIPNGAWIVVPATTMIYAMGMEVVDALASASPRIKTQ
ncbi:hypothetical protein VTJ83DRAFT_2784 [Remersonia thermophila]|uniref:Uncharacterized protein n=1 Tax=Remersonia thermophila TaxID=72144 RepID=A0ABR4DKC7_9PEZI